MHGVPRRSGVVVMLCPTSMGRLYLYLRHEYGLNFFLPQRPRFKTISSFSTSFLMAGRHSKPLTQPFLSTQDTMNIGLDTHASDRY